MKGYKLYSIIIYFIFLSRIEADIKVYIADFAQDKSDKELIIKIHISNQTNEDFLIPKNFGEILPLNNKNSCKRICFDVHCNIPKMEYINLGNHHLIKNNSEENILLSMKSNCNYLTPGKQQFSVKILFISNALKFLNISNYKNANKYKKDKEKIGLDS